MASYNIRLHIELTTGDGGSNFRYVSGAHEKIDLHLGKVQFKLVFL